MGMLYECLGHGITFGLAEPILSYIDSEANRPLSSFLLELNEKEMLPLLR